MSDLLAVFKAREALLEGHFQLSSGLHSARYLQCARVLMDPGLATTLGADIAAGLKRALTESPTIVVSAALGGVVVGHEVGRGLSVPAIFAEREGTEMSLRRGFALSSSDRVVVVEDVVTTGKSTREVVSVVERFGARVIGVGSLVDRSGGQHAFPWPLVSLLKIEVESFTPESCPLCRSGAPSIKPGSRPKV